MQPRNPLLDVYRKLTAEVVGTMDAALPAPSYLIEDNPGPLKKLRTTWSPAPKLLAKIEEDLSALGEGIFVIATNADHSTEAKNRKIDELVSSVTASIITSKSQVLDRTHELLDSMRTAAYPSRPGVPDSAQEAALAGIKSDLRMVLDGSPDLNAIRGGLKGHLARAMGDGDALATWLLASSRWPEDYLASRGANSGDVTAWHAEVAALLDSTTPADIAETRRAYRLVSDPQHGLPVLDLLLNGTITSVVSTISEWRPTSHAPTPPTRIV